MDSLVKILKRDCNASLPEYENNKLKLLLVGDYNVGKTSFCYRLSTQKFWEEYTPTVWDISVITVETQGKVYHIHTWDTAGREDYDRLRPLSYPNTDVIMLPFSIANEDSLERVESRYLPEMKHHLPRVPIILVGMKLDLRTDEKTIEALARNNKAPVSFETGAKMAQKIGAAKYVECSALKDLNMESVIEAALQAVHLKDKDNKKKTKLKGKCVLM